LFLNNIYFLWSKKWSNLIFHLKLCIFSKLRSIIFRVFLSHSSLFPFFSLLLSLRYSAFLFPTCSPSLSLCCLSHHCAFPLMSLLPFSLLIAAFLSPRYSLSLSFLFSFSLLTATLLSPLCFSLSSLLSLPPISCLFSLLFAVFFSPLDSPSLILFPCCPPSLSSLLSFSTHYFLSLYSLLPFSLLIAAFLAFITAFLPFLWCPYSSY